MPTEPVIIRPPDHPLYALTTYELRDYRHDLERAIAGTPSGAPAQADLRARLDEVLAEQESRARLSAGGTA
jgi:hypothetical protein